MSVINTNGPIRGSRVGSASPRADFGVQSVPTISVDYYCVNGHITSPTFADSEKVEIPSEWECDECGLPAGRDPQNPPQEPENIPYKTHFDYLQERRTDTDGEKLLNEALQKLRKRRGVVEPKDEA
ncbi:hypothetical protein BK816_04230 [Boudabousia tangfeifanii]|uniref:RNA polymerase-binding protein RbpA n=1 Tax=Boudabousia tangfeifanii TaxID=1912795 RepID=A0A1D9MK90_9ACTO|nr:RNA polymerase-binding protein RbpA [Boudabousia tangfeifanii]AOZ72599.1 hypothetical protein BK816_04230 [Boudabousia tangfeifanii]